jgi:four helix bundle protein
MRNYRDLQVWLRAHKLTLTIYEKTRSFPSEEKFGLTGQIRRSCASIPANLAEGCGRRSDGEMARFVQISMGSGTELSYHLLLARDLAFLSARDYAALDSELTEIMKMLSSLSSRLRSSTVASVLELKAKC